MKTLALLLAVSISISSHADSSPSDRRDQALKRINSCLRRNEVSSRECKDLNENVRTLVEVYKSGDKTVLPTLFHFTYLTDFYGEALLTDPDGFLAAMSRLHGQDRQAVVNGIAGGTWGLRNRERFEAIKAVLEGIRDSSPVKKISSVCLTTLERNNAQFVATYFPPQTFTGRAADFEVHWYSSDMYALGETPLWPPSPNGSTTYRFTYLPAFTGPSFVTLTVQQDGRGHITMKTGDGERKTTHLDESAQIPSDGVEKFLTRLDQSHFWTMSTELPRTGLDGADWILEGVKDGNYRVVVRWCPDIDKQSPDEKPFADAVRVLFELTGHKHIGGC
jgi:hypothetical protein